MAFSNRAEAGFRLAERLRGQLNEDAVVVALAPRGVPLAVEVASLLDSPLDAVLVHELTAPGCPSGVLGAAGEDGVSVLNPPVAARLGITTERLESVARCAAVRTADLGRALRERVPAQPLEGRAVLLVDDGIATGAGAQVAITVLRRRGADHLLLAVPIAARAALDRLRLHVDDLVCLRVMPWPRPVHEWYDSYPEITDDQGWDLLERHGRAACFPQRQST